MTVNALLLLIGICLLLAYFAYDFFRVKKKFKSDEVRISTQAQTIQEAKATIETLQNQINQLNNQFNQTLTDSVTHLLGWQLFEDRLKQSIKESARYQTTLGVMFVDINDFKVVNNALSYEAGDILLQEVAKRLQTCIRQVDSMSRFSKDTFTVLLTQLVKPETAAVVAQRMLQTLKAPFQIQNQELFITVSIGIAIYPLDAQDAPLLLRSADQALHLAKEKGQHNYQFYQENMHAKSQRELALYTSLGRDSILEEFALYYQPILEMQNESIFCMDALLHWQHPQLGLITPIELFHYAERQKKLNVISEWLIQQACRQFLHWRSLGFAPRYMGLPLSYAQLGNSQFIYRISQMIQELNFEPSHLLFILRGAPQQLPFETLEKAINMLKYIGVKLTLDDFGIEGVSLLDLKNINIDYLKLTPQIIKDLGSNPKSQALLKSIAELANNLTLEIIVQGIESDHQIILLKELGYHLMQGHLLGGPLSAYEVVDKMKTSTSTS